MSIIWESQVLLKNFAAHTKSYTRGGEKMIRAKLTEVRQLISDQVTNASFREDLHELVDQLEKAVVACLETQSSGGKPVITPPKPITTVRDGADDDGEED